MQGTPRPRVQKKLIPVYYFDKQKDAILTVSTFRESRLTATDSDRIETS